MNYYNDNDRFAAAWLRELIRDGLIPPGNVDERGIEEVEASDLRGYRQCHFFAGIGGWSRALAIAGVPATEPLWTGSCPCQPFSAAGKRKGTKDERHLWPEFLRLIRECRPQTIFGEQVASTDVVGTELEAAFVVAVQGGDYARANKLAHKLFRSRSLHYWARWIDGIRADLEAEDYSVRFDVLGAHSVNSPHIRQRLFWVADSANRDRRGRERGTETAVGEDGERGRGSSGGGSDGGVALAKHAERRQVGIAGNDGCHGQDYGRSQAHGEPGACGEVCGLADSMRPGRAEGRAESGRGSATDSGPIERMADCGSTGLAGRTEQSAREECTTAERSRFWDDAIWHPCRDGKSRRIPAEPALFPLAAGIPNRVGILRGAGNSIVPQVAAAFIRAIMDALAK